MTFGDLETSGSFIKQCARVAFSSYEREDALFDTSRSLDASQGGRPMNATQSPVVISCFNTQIVVWSLTENGVPYTGIGIRGTHNLENVCTDVNCELADLDDEECNVFNQLQEKELVPRVHKGFKDAFLEIRKDSDLQEMISQASRIVVTGHSLGGALAILLGLDLAANQSFDGNQANHGKSFWARLTPAALLARSSGQGASTAKDTPRPRLCVVTFGKPHVGDTQFCDFFSQYFNDANNVHVNFTAPSDPVPWLAQAYDNEYQHEGVCKVLGSKFEKIPELVVAILDARPSNTDDLRNTIQKFGMENLHSCRTYWELLSSPNAALRITAKMMAAVWDQYQKPQWAVETSCKVRGSLGFLKDVAALSMESFRLLMCGKIYLAAATIAVALPFSCMAVSAFRISTTVNIRVGEGISLVDGRCHFTSGKFQISLVEKQQRMISSDAREDQGGIKGKGPVGGFPTVLTEGVNALSFVGAWGVPRGCCGFLCYRIQGTSPSLYAVFVVNNPYDRVFLGNNVAVAVCLSACDVKQSNEQASKLCALAKKGFRHFSFNGARVSRRKVGEVSASACGYKMWGSMSNQRHQLVGFSVTRAASPGPAQTCHDAADCSGVQAALAAYDLADALTLSVQGTAVRASAHTVLPGGLLRIVNLDNKCPRYMQVSYLVDGVVHEDQDGRNGRHKFVALPQGAKDVTVTFHQRGNSRRVQIEGPDGAPREERICIGDGDGVRAIFALKGWWGSGSVQVAWDFGKKTEEHQGWERLGANAEEELRAAKKFLPKIKEAEDVERSRLSKESRSLHAKV